MGKEFLPDAPKLAVVRDHSGQLLISKTWIQLQILILTWHWILDLERSACWNCLRTSSPLTLNVTWYMSLSIIPHSTRLCRTAGVTQRWTKPISLDDHHFLATESAELALRYLRYQDRSRVLWINALCIYFNRPQWNTSEPWGLYLNCLRGLILYIWLVRSWGLFLAS